ncbi:MAG: spore germination lipoprotein GerD [Tumebacillaceae bacterium]
MKSFQKFSLAILAVLLSVVVIGVGGCNSNTEQADSGENDNDTKSMVLDILHTKEGMEALQDIVRDPRLKQSFTVTQQDVKAATIKALSDTETNMNLMEQMKNPRFGASLTKAYRKDNELVLKQLMQDPEYQTMMLSMLKSPDFQLLLFDLMKTPEYRKQAVAIMTEALHNPDFKMKMLEAIKQTIKSSGSGQQQQQGGQAKSQSQGEDQGQEKQKKEQSDGDKEQSGGDQGQGSSEGT